MSQTESQISPATSPTDVSHITPATSPTDESQGSSDTKIKVDFDDLGQVIGPNAAKFSTRLGCLTRTHCPPIYAEWSDKALDDNKRQLWEGIQADFVVPEIHKKAQLKHANKLWNDWKTKLRKHCDKYSTITERMRNCPKNMKVKTEDWCVFVDMEATEDARLLRERGKACRKEMNNPHTSGRRGAARTAEILVANNPNEGTRTDFFMATHTRPDGTYVNEVIAERMQKIKDIVASDPSSKHKDLDNDPVAEVFGIDGRGTVKGYGHGVSKTTLKAAAPYKRKAQEEYVSRMELQSQVDAMKHEMAEDRRERREIQEQLSALLGTQGSGQRSQRYFSSSPPLFNEGPMNSLPRRASLSSEQACALLSIGGIVVAYGTITTNSVGTTYEVMLTEVVDWDAELFGVAGKNFRDTDLGCILEWPKGLTRLL